MREILLTVTHSVTREIVITTDCDLDLIRNYPKSRRYLPTLVLNAIEETGDYGEVVDNYFEVVDVVDVDKELWS